MTDYLKYFNLLNEEIEETVLDENISSEEYDSIQTGDIIKASVFQINTDKPEHNNRLMLITGKFDGKVYGFYITSTNNNENMDFYKVPIKQWQQAGLRKQSYICITRHVYVEPKYIGPEPVVGHLSRDDINRLIDRLQIIIGARTWKFGYDFYSIINSLKKTSVKI